MLKAVKQGDKSRSEVGNVAVDRARGKLLADMSDCFEDNKILSTSRALILELLGKLEVESRGATLQQSEFLTGRRHGCSEADQ